MGRGRLTRPLPWRGAEVTGLEGFACPLAPADIEEIERALERAAALPHAALSPATFPLPRLSGRLSRMSEVLSKGSGVVRITGVPVERYPPPALRTVYLGLSSHLGTATVQNRVDGLLREIRDRSAEGGRRVDSADALGWHNDRTDVVGLLCVRPAASGGTSRIASAVAIHDAMAERSPELLDTLFEDFARYAPGDEVGATGGVYRTPVFRVEAGALHTHYSRTYIGQAAEREGGVPLSARQTAALDALVATAEEVAFEMDLRPGDIQYLNNHAILHGRTAFRDPSPTEGRHLLRVWLSTQGNRTWNA
jgi:hypothetical protein